MFDNPEINEQIALKTLGFLYIISILTIAYNARKKNATGKKIFFRSFILAYVISLIVFIISNGISDMFGLLFGALLPSFALCSVIYYLIMGFRFLKTKLRISN